MKAIRRLAGLAAVSCVALAALAPGALAKIPHGRFGVGDSIMVSASDELADYGFGVNAEVGRQFSAGVPVVRRLANKDKLPRHVVVHLGTNGPVDPDDCDALIGFAGRRHVYLVTVRVPRDWEAEVNRTLRKCATRHDRASVINWYGASADHPEWLASDGYHLTAAGQAAFAALIDRKVDAMVASLRSA